MQHTRFMIGDDVVAGAAWGQATRAWVQEHLGPSEHVTDVVRLHGGWTSEMRRLNIAGNDGQRALVLRSLVHPFFVEHAHGLLTREADVLQLLEATDVPVARLIAVDASAERCDYPALLMSLLPGSVRLVDDGAGLRADQLAHQLVSIHRVQVSAQGRPRSYEPWTTPDLVRPPVTTRPQLWRQAVEIIRRPPPDHVPCFLHRDFHPGNVLFDGQGDQMRISGVVDWVETSWGPADLDVAHCSTNLALLHGTQAGMAFAERYIQAGGSLTADPTAHLYWRLIDALAFAPTAEKVAEPWRALGRSDLSDALVASRLEDYVEALIDRYA